MSTDPIKSKNYSGTFAGGQGPVLGQEVKSEGETSKVFGGEEKTLKVSSEGGTDPGSQGKDEHFDLHGKSYAGPENMRPENKGVVNPDDIQHC